jgi:hypothetical protein
MRVGDARGLQSIQIDHCTSVSAAGSD